jgi:ankyrin repeat protein
MACGYSPGGSHPQSSNEIDGLIAKLPQGNSALFHAFACGRKNFVELLLDHGADINLKNNGGASPFLAAANRAKSAEKSRLGGISKE